MRSCVIASGHLATYPRMVRWGGPPGPLGTPTPRFPIEVSPLPDPRFPSWSAVATYWSFQICESA